MGSVFGTLAGIATGPFRAIARMATTGNSKEKPVELKVLHRVSGVIRPGTLTLLIAPPGHGKSSYLKMLTQLLPVKAVKGAITYSGVKPVDAPAAGVHLGQMAQYVSQRECARARREQLVVAEGAWAAP